MASTISTIKAIKGAFSDNDDDNDNNETEEHDPTESELEKQYIEGLRFNTKNAEKLIAQLDKLGNKILTQFLSFSLSKNNFHLAESKFEEGISILQSLDSTNHMLPIFRERLEKWKKRNDKNKRYRLIAWAVIAIAVVVFFIWAINQDK